MQTTLCFTCKGMMLIYRRLKDGLSGFAMHQGGKLTGTKVEDSV